MVLRKGGDGAEKAPHFEVIILGVYGHCWHFYDNVLAGLLKRQVPQPRGFLENVILWGGSGQSIDLLRQSVDLGRCGGCHVDGEAWSVWRQFFLAVGDIYNTLANKLTLNLHTDISVQYIIYKQLINVLFEIKFSKTWVEYYSK